MTKPMLILVSGLFMTGTNGDEGLIRENLARMEAMALPLFKKGHLGVVGEWLAWPVISAAGGDSPEFTEYQYPVAHRLPEGARHGQTRVHVNGRGALGLTLGVRGFTTLRAPIRWLTTSPDAGARPRQKPLKPVLPAGPCVGFC